MIYMKERMLIEIYACELLEESEVDEDEMNLRLELSESNESDDSDF